MADYSGLEAASTRERLRTVGTGIGLAVGGFMVAIAVILLGVVVAGAFGVSLRDNPLLLYPTFTILQGLGFGLTVLAYVVLSDRRDLIRFGVPSLRDVGWMVLGVVGLLGSLAAISFVFSQLGVQTAENQIQRIGSRNPGVMLYMIPLAFLVIGPGEELLFRGAIQGLFRRSYAAVPAIALSSALFAVAHVQSLVGASMAAKAATISALFVLSLVLGAVYELTDNLVVPSVVHGAYDALVFLLIYARATGLA